MFIESDIIKMQTRKLSLRLPLPILIPPYGSAVVVIRKIISVAVTVTIVIMNAMKMIAMTKVVAY